MRVKSLIIDFLRMLCRYIIVVIGGTCLFIVLARIIGYLAYSDRPGPGWYGLFPSLTLQGLMELLSFVAGWGLLALIYTPFAVIPVFLVVRMLEWSGTPRYINAVVGGFLAGVISTWFILGMGWYIALAGPAVLVAGVLGLFYGGWILPAHNRDSTVSTRFSPWRFVTTLGISVSLAYLLFPDLLRSVVFGRKDSYAVQGVLSNNDVALVGIKVRYFNDPGSCRGEFTEAVTDSKGNFNFLHEYTSDQFPKKGPCVYKVTLCYLADDEWHKFWSSGHSGPCGGRSIVEVRYDLARPGSYQMKSRF